ncbi:MAG: nitrous oxide-stimulated promoter family protein [Eubacterium sp.]
MAHNIESEQKIIAEMIRLYCRKHHHTKALCDECSGLLDYAAARLNHCPFKDDKTFCSHCTIHCYKPEMRKRIKTVMGFSGPRMLFHHPVLLLRHALKK